jgi:hypothetical protein
MRFLQNAPQSQQTLASALTGAPVAAYFKIISVHTQRRIHKQSTLPRITRQLS